MRSSALAIVILLTCGGAPAWAQPAQDEAADVAAVLQTVQTFFDTMATKDADGSRRVLMPGARFHSVREADGKLVTRSFTTEEYVAGLATRQTKVLERFWNPDIRIRGAIATVWTPYDFWTDGTFSHCGIDAFDLVKADDGWKLSGGIYTVETRGCEPSPLGPPKP